MSFGPKLLDLPVVAAGAETSATLAFVPIAAEFEHEAHIYVEDLGGLRTLTVIARGKTREPDPQLKALH